VLRYPRMQAERTKSFTESAIAPDEGVLEPRPVSGKRDRRLNPSRFDSDYYHLLLLRQGIQTVIRKHLAGGVAVLVDLGCGKMPYRSLFEPHVGRYIGVDLPGSPGADAFADTATSRSSLVEKSADFVISTQVLEHVPDPASYLREAHRLLADDGKLMLSTHGLWAYHPVPTDFWRWTSSGLKKQVEDAGFEIIEFEGQMGAAAAGVQLFQDSVHHKMYNWTKKPFFLIMQTWVMFVDWFYTRSARIKDASVYMLVARKAAVPRTPSFK